MAFVGIKVDDATKVLWVTAASGEGVSLSEWVRRCAAARLAAGEAGSEPGRAAPLEPGSPGTEGLSGSRASLAANPDRLAGETTAATVPADEASVGDTAISEPQAPASDPTLETRLAEARRMIGGAPKQFRPDFKKEKKPKH